MKNAWLLLLFLVVFNFNLFGDEQQPVVMEFCTDVKENSPSLSSDGLNLYYHSDSKLGEGGEDIWYVVRESKSTKWSTPINVGGQINTKYHEWAPFISKDGLSLYFASDRPGGLGGYDIWVSVRKNTKDEWSIPHNLGSKINSAADEANPCISQDELYLIFSDYGPNNPRTGSLGMADLWYSMRENKDAEWNQSLNVGPIINSTGNDVYPRLAINDLVLLFSTNRDGGYGNRDIWYSIRSNRTSEWQKPINLGAIVNTSFIEVGLIISEDREDVMFVSDRRLGSGILDIYYIKSTELIKILE